MNPFGWPQEVLPVFERAATAMYASLTRRDTPVTWPLTPYVNPDGRSVDVCTGLTYPTKAERARRNPKVALLFGDPVGSGIREFPTLLVKGMATVKDADLQAGADRYVKSALAKLPDSYKGNPWFVLKRQAWYWTRVWIHITPVSIYIWPNGDLEAEPKIWEAPSGIEVPPSDPPPQGPAPGSYQKAPGDWRARAEQALGMGNPALTVVSNDGWPIPLPVRSPETTREGFSLQIPTAVPVSVKGPACLTFHVHSERFAGQENASFVGDVTAEGGRAEFRVERPLGDFSLPEGRIAAPRSFLAKAKVLSPRLESEARRRGQGVPEIRKT